jgi:hypothetical protein
MHARTTALALLFVPLPGAGWLVLAGPGWSWLVVSVDVWMCAAAIPVLVLNIVRCCCTVPYAGPIVAGGFLARPAGFTVRGRGRCFTRSSTFTLTCRTLMI